MRIPNNLPIESKITTDALKREFNKLLAYCRSIAPRGDGKTIKVNVTGSGTTLSTVNQSRGSASGGGSAILWAKVTTATDANNYVCAIYDRADEGTAIESGKECRVFDIVDTLAVGDWFPVQASNVTNEDYECIQQLGVIG